MVRASGNSDRAASTRRVSSCEEDLLYAIARDPQTLFIYWEVQWPRLFEHAQLSARTVHLRVFREDGSVDATQEVNPFAGYAYVSVTSPGAHLYCELGCFDGESWRALLRSGKTMTPESRVSDDLSAQFATLPMHLSFQRMLETIGPESAERATLARSVGEMQESARAMPEPIQPQKWSQLLSAISSAYHTGGVHSSDLTALLQAAQRQPPPAPPTPDQQERWRLLGETWGASSWGGASEMRSL